MVELDSNSNVCADCGASLSAELAWASINRGVFICTECCYIHRSLGRHVSYVKSVSKGIWSFNEIELLKTLYANGSNNIWEHSLYDPQNHSKSKKKPNSNDPVIPKKETFIKAKYMNLAYTIRPSKDEDNTSLDLNRQLWSCVRTSHVETTLRLLALGADPNYSDPDKGNCPLHIAAKEGQMLQAELLWIYGGDVAQKNSAGHSPSDLAKMEGHYDLFSRLEELEFEVTDRLSMFLCGGRKPDHSKGIHFLIPELSTQTNDSIKQFRKQLQTTSCLLFEKLIQDVYDEVDRRETNAQWNAVQSVYSMGLYDSKHVAVFLPPNPEFSATRNQLRQKLAKYDPRDFSQMIIDLLKEAKRRFLGQPLPSFDETTSTFDQSGGNFSLASPKPVDDSYNRDYDDVPDLEQRKSGSTHRSSSNKSEMQEKDRFLHSTPTIDDFLELKEKVHEANQKISSVVQINQQIVRDIALLQNAVKTMDIEKMEQQRILKSIQESLSMIARRNATSPVNFAPSLSTQNTTSKRQLPLDNSKPIVQRHGSLTNPLDDIPQPIGSRHESRNSSAPPDSDSPKNPVASQSFDSSGNNFAHFRTTTNGGDNLTFPDNLIGETELLIVAIKKFLAEIKDSGSGTNAMYHADSIDFNIKRIIQTIPKQHKIPGLKKCIDDIHAAMAILTNKCAAQYFNVNDACQCAYDVAKCAKQLLVKAHSQTELP